MSQELLILIFASAFGVSAWAFRAYLRQVENSIKNISSITISRMNQLEKLCNQSLIESVSRYDLLLNRLSKLLGSLKEIPPDLSKNISDMEGELQEIKKRFSYIERERTGDAKLGLLIREMQSLETKIYIHLKMQEEKNQKTLELFRYFNDRIKEIDKSNP